MSTSVMPTCWPPVTSRRLRGIRNWTGLPAPGSGPYVEVTPLGDGRSRIRQTASFDPRGVLGRAYWYAVFPVHAVMFRGLLRRIAQLAGDDRSAPVAGRGARPPRWRRAQTAEP